LSRYEFISNFFQSEAVRGRLWHKEVSWVVVLKSWEVLICEWLPVELEAGFRIGVVSDPEGKERGLSLLCPDRKVASEGFSVNTKVCTSAKSTTEAVYCIIKDLPKMPERYC
jgi:hypothetical protein